MTGEAAAGHRTSGFYIAPFAPDGELLEVGFWDYQRLSPKWLAAGRKFVEHASGEPRRISWGNELSHIETRLTVAQGAAIGSFYVTGHLANSCLLLTGRQPIAEAEVRELFIASVKRAAKGAGPAEAFDAVGGIDQRPLAVCVIWAPEEVSDDDMELVRELSLHVSAAFFLREQTWEWSRIS